MLVLNLLCMPGHTRSIHPHNAIRILLPRTRIFNRDKNSVANSSQISDHFLLTVNMVICFPWASSIVSLSRSCSLVFLSCNFISQIPTSPSFPRNYFLPASTFQPRNLQDSYTTFFWDTRYSCLVKSAVL